MGWQDMARCPKCYKTVDAKKLRLDSDGKAVACDVCRPRPKVQ